MGLILRWLLGKMVDLIAGCVDLAIGMSTNAFDNAIVKAFLNAFQIVGLPLVGVSALVVCIKAIIQIADGDGVSFADIMKRLVVGTLMYSYGVKIFKYLYLYILEITNEMITILAGADVTSFSTEDLTGGANGLFSLILMIVAVFYMLKTIMSILERFWLLLMTLCMMYFYIPGYIAGNDESLILWGKQAIGFALTQLFQTSVLVLGITFFVQGGGFSNFGLAIGAIIAASKADMILDKFGQSSGGKLSNVGRNAMSSVYSAKMILKK
ncbi:hypothetical protein EDD63_1504 [Breznakia blatticola]|uniref:TrbL/VirB6 plasmid conjugal transfer protein n=1 Tax=Breznakia blatticola TaxID=1754012 RepID=A0A4R7ZA34_9FIRM|nr:conjugal transfer protein TrbL family protein [Breznakia blatticola]TDW13098.1 hypothetical protein EDD63_1504 [Breznakia blatticola]